MAIRKYVWVTCSICSGAGEESVVILSWQGGYTTYKQYAKECTNCQGDGGHRMPVLAPDPDSEVVNQQITPKNPWPEPPPIKQPEWWNDGEEPAYD